MLARQDMQRNIYIFFCMRTVHCGYGVHTTKAFYTTKVLAPLLTILVLKSKYTIGQFTWMCYFLQICLFDDAMLTAEQRTFFGVSWRLRRYADSAWHQRYTVLSFINWHSNVKTLLHLTNIDGENVPTGNLLEFVGFFLCRLAKESAIGVRWVISWRPLIYTLLGGSSSGLPRWRTFDPLFQHAHIFFWQLEMI